MLAKTIDKNRGEILSERLPHELLLALGPQVIHQGAAAEHHGRGKRRVDRIEQVTLMRESQPRTSDRPSNRTDENDGTGDRATPVEECQQDKPKNPECDDLQNIGI